MKNFIIVVISVFVGAIFGAKFIEYFAKNSLIIEHKSPYDYNKTIETIVNRINASNGWKVISIINQSEEVKKGSNKNIGDVTIIKYCNAKHSGEMLSSDDRKKMAVSMPISIAVYNKSTGETIVATTNGILMSKLYGGETERIIEYVSKDVENILSFMNFKFTRF